MYTSAAEAGRFDGLKAAHQLNAPRAVLQQHRLVRRRSLYIRVVAEVELDMLASHRYACIAHSVRFKVSCLQDVPGATEACCV